MRVKLLLIVSHNPLDAVLMEVAGHLGQGKTHLGELEQRPLKQVMVIGLEMDLTPLLQHVPITPQKIYVGEAAA